MKELLKKVNSVKGKGFTYQCIDRKTIDVFISLESELLHFESMSLSEWADEVAHLYSFARKDGTFNLLRNTERELLKSPQIRELIGADLIFTHINSKNGIVGGFSLVNRYEDKVAVIKENEYLDEKNREADLIEAEKQFTPSSSQPDELTITRTRDELRNESSKGQRARQQAIQSHSEYEMMVSPYRDTIFEMSELSYPLSFVSPNTTVEEYSYVVSFHHGISYLDGIRYVNQRVVELLAKE